MHRKLINQIEIIENDSILDFIMKLIFSKASNRPQNSQISVCKLLHIFKIIKLKLGKGNC